MFHWLSEELWIVSYIAIFMKNSWSKTHFPQEILRSPKIFILRSSSINLSLGVAIFNDIYEYYICNSELTIILIMDPLRFGLRPQGPCRVGTWESGLVLSEEGNPAGLSSCSGALEKEWQPTPVFLPGESHGKRSLVGYSSWGLRVGHDWATNTFTASVLCFFFFYL